MKISPSDLRKYLKEYFGFSDFRGLQEDVINTIMDGKNTFAIMPTGGGKSLCYQLPAFIIDGTAIVISPLIALMKNQVDFVRGMFQNDGVAHVLNSSLKRKQVEQVKSDLKNKITKILYLAPESLNKDDYSEFLKTLNISFVAIDEVHCISEWGHDFRPEYRNIKAIIERLGNNIPIIALTATATPKVQQDILKNLSIGDAEVFKASFNRPNLYYEVRPKMSSINSDIIRFIKKNQNKSGIIYCLSRKKVEELSQFLQVNGISAVPYHAGLDSKTRVKHQDMFLMEDVNVVVATIAFGMGIDKPDVRFVIHHDIPKSLESYYQETGRAGRDGGEGYCLAFYSHKDIEKLENFTQNKSLSEQEVSHSLLQHIVAYAETSMSRRKFLLHYFGEEFDEVNGDGANMDDNVRNPKKQIEAKDEVQKLLKVIRDSSERFRAKEIVNIMVGKLGAIIKSRKIDQESFFGCGRDKDANFWMTLIHQINIANYIIKQVETYGILLLTEDGHQFIKTPESFMVAESHNYDETQHKDELNLGGGVLDEVLLKLLKNLRDQMAKKMNVPPYVIFLEPSLEDMVLHYPQTLEELKNIHGVGEGKAKKYGKEFVNLINKYVEENDIIKPEYVVVKSTGANSINKPYIIQCIDKKIPFQDIAMSKGLSTSELLREMEQIIYNGTNMDISYLVDELFDEDSQEELHEYFLSIKEDDINKIIDEFDEDYDEEEIRLYRLKFMNDLAN